MFEEDHAYILKKAIKLAKPLNMKGYERFAEKGVVSTDKYFGVVHHFYNPKKNRGAAFLGNAKKRGVANYNQAVRLYGKGKKKQAFNLLGSALHYLMDLAIPAHTKLIMHPFSTDDLELYIQKNIKKIKIKAKPIRKNKIEDYFIELAKLSSRFKTEKNNVLISIKFKILGGKKRLNPKILKKQAAKVVSYAISYSAGLIKRFEEESAPKTTC